MPNAKNILKCTERNEYERHWMFTWLENVKNTSTFSSTLHVRKMMLWSTERTKCRGEGGKKLERLDEEICFKEGQIHDEIRVITWNQTERMTHKIIMKCWRKVSQNHVLGRKWQLEVLWSQTIMHSGERDKNYNFSMIRSLIKLSLWLYKFVVSIFKGLIVPSDCCHLSKDCGNYCRQFFLKTLTPHDME